jgi:hypothetical protein
MELLLIITDPETGEVLAEKSIKDPQRNISFIEKKYINIWDKAKREQESIDKWNSREL